MSSRAFFSLATYSTFFFSHLSSSAHLMWLSSRLALALIIRDSKANTASNEDFKELEASTNSCSSREISSIFQFRMSTASRVSTSPRSYISMPVERNSSSGMEEKRFSSVGVWPNLTPLKNWILPPSSSKRAMPMSGSVIQIDDDRRETEWWWQCLSFFSFCPHR